MAERAPNIFVDEGVSAWKGEHRKKGQLGELLRLAGDGDEIVINDYSRWSREHPLDGLNALRETTDRGVKVTFQAGGLSVSKENFKQLFGMLSLLAQMANAENEERSRKIKSAYSGRKEQMQQGRITFGRLPAWLRWDLPRKNPNRKPIEIPEKVELVKKIFALCVEGDGVHTLEQKMRQYPPLSNYGRKSEWNSRWIHRLLTATKYPARKAK